MDDLNGLTDDGTPDDYFAEGDEEIKRLQREVNKLASNNRDGVQLLNQRGGTLNSLQMTQLRLEVLTTAILGNLDKANRLAFEKMWQEALREQISQLTQESTKNKLHVPGR